MAKARLMPALGAGFSLIAKHPLATLVWGVVYFGLTMAPSFLVMRMAGPDLVDYYRQLFANPAAASAARIPPSVQAMQSLEGLQLLGGLAAIALVFTAIQRAVLFPEKSSFFYLRVSWAELRSAIVVVILYVLFIVAVMVAVIVLSIPLIGFLVAAGGGMASHVVGVIGMTFLMMFLVTAGIGYPFIRLTMAIPMSLAEDRFRLFEAWTLTKGYGWPLFALALLLVLGVIASEILLFGVLFTAAVGAMGGFDIRHFQAFFGQPDWVQRGMGWLVLIGLVYAVLAMVMTPLMVAPWARAYQLITGVKTEDEHAVFD
jgi:hypothetical protein